VDFDTVRKVFEYRDGHLYWKSPSNPSKTPVGMRAGTVSKRGYIHIQYKRKVYKAHRLVYLMHTGNICELLDHINGDPIDNRIENLRPATCIQNQQNAKLRRDSSSGVKNVTWHSRIKKWAVGLRFNGKRTHFGYFDDLELAELVASEARDKYHGVFANHGAYALQGCVR
jgi:hypothetical protein